MPMPKRSSFWHGEGGKVVGRVAAIIDRNHNRFHDENAGFFGFFESVDDVEVARALLERRGNGSSNAARSFCAAR